MMSAAFFHTMRTGSRRAEIFARGCAIALGFSIPVSVAFDNVLLGLILVAWLASGRYIVKHESIRRNRVVLVALAFFALLAVGVGYSAGNPGDGLNTLGKYADLAFVPIFATLFRDARPRQFAWIAFGAAIAITLVLSWLAHFGAVRADWLVSADPANPMVFKRYITQGLLLVFGAFVFALLARDTRSTRWRWFWIVLAALAVLNVVFLNAGRTSHAVFLCLAPVCRLHDQALERRPHRARLRGGIARHQRSASVAVRPDPPRRAAGCDACPDRNRGNASVAA